MQLPPAIIVHGLPMARLALQVASGRKLTLLSAHGAGAYAGVGWWRAMVRAATAGLADQTVPDLLDCGTSPGRALEALRAGQVLLVLQAEPPVWAGIASRADAAGATLLAAPPPALDMAAPDAVRRLGAWLTSGAGDRPGRIG